MAECIKEATGNARSDDATFYCRVSHQEGGSIDSIADQRGRGAEGHASSITKRTTKHARDARQGACTVRSREGGHDG